jgi:hypothetical protein
LEDTFKEIDVVDVGSVVAEAATLGLGATTMKAWDDEQRRRVRIVLILVMKIGKRGTPIFLGRLLILLGRYIVESRREVTKVEWMEVRVTWRTRGLMRRISFKVTVFWDLRKYGDWKFS